LYRPVGLRELELIATSGFRTFPPRLPWQPIFYPVLSREYATSIARNWNTKDPASGYAGFITAFEAEDEYVGKFPVRQVGGGSIKELWVPAEELEEFNNHLVGPIRVIEWHYGERFQGEVDTTSGLPCSAIAANQPG
jgi:hypothetical protein